MRRLRRKKMAGFNPFSEDWKKLDWKKQLEQREIDRKKFAEATLALQQQMQAQKQALRSQISSQINTPSINPPQPLLALGLKFQTEPIVGWRVWATVRHQLRGGVEELRLKSVGVHGNWHGYRRVEASCNHNHHDAPHPSCHCGLWALKEEQQTEQVGLTYAANVYGEVYLWGRVLECALGWRAQYAYPKVLYTYIEEYVEPLRETYGVPVEYRQYKTLQPNNPETPLNLALPGGSTFVPPSSGIYIQFPIVTTSTGYSTNVSTQTGVQSWVSYGNSTGSGTQISGGGNNTA